MALALRTKASTLNSETIRQLQHIYADTIPFEARYALEEWLENYPWSDLDPDNPNHENYIESFVQALIEEINVLLHNESNFIIRLKLTEAAEILKTKFLHNPTLLVRSLKRCIQQEMNILHPSDIMDIHLAITTKIEELKRKTNEYSGLIPQLQQSQENFVINYQRINKCKAHREQLTKQGATSPGNRANMEYLATLIKEEKICQETIQQQLNEIHALRMNLYDSYQGLILLIEELQKIILESELTKWKRNQQLHGNGVKFDNNLDQIQEWCESLADIIWLNRKQLKRIEFLNQHVEFIVTDQERERFNAMIKHITNLLSSLITSTFVLETQPPQVMKTNTRFTAIVRLLVGGVLNVHMTPPQVKVAIISEAQANALLKNDKIGALEPAGEILNNTGSMEYHQSTRHLMVIFRNMQLKKIKRAEKKGTESVMDEKFALLFQSQFAVGGGELLFQVWTLSLPVVVIVHGNQEPHAWATITWDNAFTEPGRVPFQVPDKVKWSQLAEVLSTKFKAACERELSPDNLRFLAAKVFRNANLPEPSNHLVSWSQFCKEPLHERNFTFWEWFYAIVKVTRDNLKPLWVDGLIMGFISRSQAEELLKKSCDGTFLLRFSDSELGGVTVAWVAKDHTGDNPEVFMIQPFTSKDFNIRSLADRISDLKNLQFLYPDIPKDHAFASHYSKLDNLTNSNNGYVKPLLVNTIPGLSKSLIDSNPSTPSTFAPAHSPEASFTSEINSLPEEVVYNNMDLMGMDLSDMDPMDFSAFNELMTYSTKQA